MVRDTPMFKLFDVSFGVIEWEDETLVKSTKDVLHFLMYAETIFYARQTYIQVLLQYI